MAKASQENTTFITPCVKYQFVTIPFGLVSPPSTFQSLMDQPLEGTQMFAAAYLDDVILRSRCWEEHLEYLSKILTRLGKVGLTIKESKCKFTHNQCEYLGRTVENGKGHPLQAKVQAIQDFTHPITKKQTLLSWVYVVLLPFHSRLFHYCNPLTELIRKDKPNIIAVLP